jgi:hypothetical protein
MAKKKNVEDDGSGMADQSLSEACEKVFDAAGFDVVPTPGGIAGSMLVRRDESTAETTPNAAGAKPEAQPDIEKRFAKLSKWERRITRANDTFRELNREVAERDSEVKAAKGRLAAAIEDRDAAGTELSKLIDDHKAGQDYLFDDEPKMECGPPITADNIPISELSVKQLAKLLGDTLMEESKNRDEPLGLTGPQLEKFESAGIHTIHDLEERMTSKPHDWWEFLAKKADAAIVTRVLNSWREFRLKCPVPERPQTVVESLAEQNAAAKSAATCVADAVWPSGVELKSGSEWATEFGTVVCDPDGWRGDGPGRNEGLDFETPISRDDFVRRWSQSTCRGASPELLALANGSGNAPDTAGTLADVGAA